MEEMVEEIRGLLLEVALLPLAIFLGWLNNLNSKELARR